MLSLTRRFPLPWRRSPAHVGAEPWLFAYALLGLAQSGLAPILMPLATHGGTSSGLTYAAFALSGLAAPMFGTWADRTGRHRDLLTLGCLLAAVCLGLFFFASGGVRILLAAGAGLGAMAATTAGNVLAIQGQPEDAWDDRVARLQRFISAGQVIGLVVAGVLARTHVAAGFLFGAAALLGGAGLGARSAPGRQARAPHAKAAPRPLTGGEAGVVSTTRHHHANVRELVAHLRSLGPTLRHLLVLWLVGYTFMSGIAVMFPVVMTRQFHMDPTLPSAAYAIGVGLSLFAYHSASGLAHRKGGAWTMVAGFGARLVLFAAMTALGLLRADWAGLVILSAFVLMQVSWPLLSVGANVLVVRSNPGARGESIGLFNASTSLASSIGSALGGVIFGLYGFSTLSGVAAGAVAVAIGLAVVWRGGQRPNAA
ncbi:MAG: MFS transporter [Acetobacteraceae bacterium]|nr:MFS transporter [Acetobacteraceae bacterium]